VSIFFRAPMAHVDIFKQLTRGARFDPTKTAKETALFLPPPPTATAPKRLPHQDSKPAKPVPEPNGAVKRARKKKYQPRPLSEVSGRDLRRREGIQVTGTDVPVPIFRFEQLMPVYGVPQYVTDVLLARSYEAPSPIQMQAWPVMLKRRDLVACAPTGSGKTLAFLVPLLTLLGAHSPGGLRALVLSPTKELSQQTEREAARFLVAAAPDERLELLRLSTSVAGNPQRLNAADMLVSTTKRLLDVLEGKVTKTDHRLDLTKVEHLVMDEADALFTGTLREQLDSILVATTHPSLVKSVFSATLDGHAQKLISTVLSDSVSISVGKRVLPNVDVQQRLLFCSNEDSKVLTIKQLFTVGLELPALIFVQSRDRADELHRELRAMSLTVGIIHSGRSHDQREETIRLFRLGKLACLICSELLARGIDFKNVGTVINFDIPTSSVKYIHRIGRTGRAHKRGFAVTLFTPEDSHYVKVLAPIIQSAGGEVQPWMLALRRDKTDKTSRRRRKAGFNRAPLRVKEEAGLKEMAAAQAAAPKDQPKVKASDWLESRRQKGAKGTKRKKDTQDADHPRKKKPRKSEDPA